MAIISNERDKSLQSVAYRTMDTSVTIVSSGGIAFTTPKNGAVTVPANITLTAAASVIFTAPTYTWHYALSSTPTTWVLLGTGNLQTITSSFALSIIGTNSSINFRCTVSQNLLTNAYGYFTIQYSAAASEPVVVNLTRVIATVSCDATGTPISFVNTDTAISVTRGTSNLAYSATGGANTFNVTISSASGVTYNSALLVGSGNTYTLPAITSLTVDSGKIIFAITPYDAAGVAMTAVGKEIVYTKVTSGLVGSNGSNAIFYYLDIPTPVISKSTSSPLISGTHTSITIGGIQVNGATTTAFGYVTITGNGGTEVGTATAITTANPTTTFTPSNNAQYTTYTAKLYNQASVSGATLLDTQTIPVVFVGGSSVIATSTNTNVTIPTNTDGSVGVYTNTPTDIYVYEGGVALTYNGTGVGNGTWKATTFATGITAGTVTAFGTTAARTTLASNISADTATIRFDISGTFLGGGAFTATTTQNFAKGKAGAAGAPGVGTRIAIVTVYAWSNYGIPTYQNTSTTYTWATSTNSTIPTGWAYSVGGAPGSGYVLYQINLTITGLTTDGSTNATWTNASVATIGYRNDGSIGPQGNSSRTAYLVTTNPVAPNYNQTPVTPSTNVSGDAPPISINNYNLDGTTPSWSFTATSTLLSGQYMYQVDGTLNNTPGTTNYTGINWGIPYLSNLKVGSLSAISANLGAITAGQLNINNKFIVTPDGSTTIQSSTTGPRMLITENFIKIFDGSSLRVQLGNLSL